MIDFDGFEEFQGEKPFRLLDRHPDNVHLAMQVQTSDAFLAAIWSNETKHLVWSTEDTYSLAWLQQEAQIAALQNPLFEPENFFFAIYSWPQGDLLQQCPITFPRGYFFDLIASPKNDFSICQWMDQCAFGFEFVENHSHGVVHLVQNGYINRKTNFATRPVFSPDGRLWVCGYQESTSWWTDETALDNFDRPAK